MKINKEEAILIALRDSERFELIEEHQTGDSRWSILHDDVIKEINTGKFYGFAYSTPKGDNMGYDDEFYDEYELIEVVPEEVGTTIYVKKDG